MKKVLVFGGSGLVGSKFIELYCQSFKIQSPTASEVDILNKDAVAKLAQEFNPDSVINLAAYTQVENAEAQKGTKGGICYLINAVGAKNVAEVCREFDKKLIHISTEYVFDGTKSDSPYAEQDRPNPINWYGQTKYFGEQFILESRCPATIIRISMPFSSFYKDKKDIARFFLEQLQIGNQIKAIEDQKITPILVSDIADALRILIESENLGIYHICSKNSTTPFNFAKAIAQEFNIDASLIKPISLDEYNKNKKAKLLRNSWLDSAKFRSEFGEGILHTIEESVQIFKKQLAPIKSGLTGMA